MNISSIYPEGTKVARNSANVREVLDPELKRKVLDMIDRGIRIVRICEKFNIDKGTVFNWQESKERY